MKKKLFFGISLVVILAVLNININFGKSNHNGNSSLKNLFSLTQADAEGGGQAFCNYYCQMGGTCCTLHVGGSGTTYYVNCYYMHF